MHSLCSDNMPSLSCLSKYSRTEVEGRGSGRLGAGRGKVEAPRYLVPCYFDAVVTGAFVVLRQHAFSLMSE